MACFDCYELPAGTQLPQVDAVREGAGAPNFPERVRLCLVQGAETSTVVGRRVIVAEPVGPGAEGGGPAPRTVLDAQSCFRPHCFQVVAAPKPQCVAPLPGGCFGLACALHETLADMESYDAAVEVLGVLALLKQLQYPPLADVAVRPAERKRLRCLLANCLEVAPTWELAVAFQVAVQGLAAPAPEADA